MMETENIQISKLVDIGNPRGVFDEVKTVVSMIFSDFDFVKLGSTFTNVVKLFQGEYAGYHKCNTEYHDLRHTMGVLLAMARLVHGACLQEKGFSRKNIGLGLISALFHDTGYIQSSDETSGTGAKYTLVHLQRSIDFMDKYFNAKGFSREDFENCRDMLSCTDLNRKIDDAQFKSMEIKLLGKMLGTADLLGQVADRIYLEKLLLLFYEFKEGKVGGYSSEKDLLKKTLRFFDFMKKKFDGEFDNVNKYAIYHFKKRWNINRDLYEEAVEKSRSYLMYIFTNYEKEYRRHLKRGGIIKKLEEDGK